MFFFRVYISCVILTACSSLLYGRSEEVDMSIFSVDFEESMGKNDPYMNSFYEKFMKVLGSPEHSFFRYVHPYSPTELIRLCRNLYEKNRPSVESLSPTARIPCTFHQIWVGKKPFPEKYKKWQETWKAVPGWSYKLWTDEDVEKLDFPNKEIYLQEKNMGARADILRIEILYQFGGVYADTDFELLQPEYFTLLNRSLDFYTCLQPLDLERFVIANGLIGSVPHHPILKACRENVQSRPTDKDNYIKIVNNGLGLFTKMILQHADKGYRDLVFPSTFFYPLGAAQMHKKPYSSMPDNLVKLEKLKQDTIKSESIATHWWEGSWKLPDSWE